MWFRDGLEVYLVCSGSVLGMFLRVYRWSTGMYWSVLGVQRQSKVLLMGVNLDFVLVIT